MNNKYKILLVEDEQNISTLVMTMLETAGYQVIPAGTCAMGRRLRPPAPSAVAVAMN